MPSYRTHDFSTVLTAVVTFIAGIHVQQAGRYAIVTLGILFAGCLCNGDLDTSSRLHHRWLFLKLYWKPYQKYLPHRHLLTHGPILGTLIRFLYLSPLLLVLFLPYNHFYGIQGNEFGILLAFLVGCEISQLVHTSLDFLV